MILLLKNYIKNFKIKEDYLNILIILSQIMKQILWKIMIYFLLQKTKIHKNKN